MLPNLCIAPRIWEQTFTEQPELIHYVLKLLAYRFTVRTFMDKMPSLQINHAYVVNQTTVFESWLL